MNALCILYRQPVPGEGKTRLRKGLRTAITDHKSADKAADRLYLSFLMDLRERTADFDGRVLPFVSGKHGDNAFLPGSRPQASGGLGLRMASALETAFSEGAERALLIGSDAPWLDATFLHRCLRALDHTGAVLGPSIDGGYYLIGFRAGAYTSSVFELSSWGHEQVLKQTKELLLNLGVTVTEEKIDNDFDDLIDLKRYFIRPGSDQILPHTWAVYQSLSWRNDNEY